jgi:hypothetical protein
MWVGPGAAGSDAEEPAADGDSPLHKAALGGHAEVVALLKQRVQVSGGTRLLFLVASLVADAGIVSSLTISRHACCLCFLKTSWMAAPPLQLDQRNSSGSTALYNAASQGHAAVVRELAEEGAAGEERRACRSPVAWAGQGSCTVTALVRTHVLIPSAAGVASVLHLMLWVHALVTCHTL